MNDQFGEIFGCRRGPSREAGRAELDALGSWLEEAKGDTPLFEQGGEAELAAFEELQQRICGGKFLSVGRVDDYCRSELGRLRSAEARLTPTQSLGRARALNRVLNR